MDRYPYSRYTILLEATRALAHIGVHIYTSRFRPIKFLCDEHLKYSFYPYALVIFSSVFMLNKCPNALKVHTYDQVIHMVELCKIGGKTATEAAGEATVF